MSLSGITAGASGVEHLGSRALGQGPSQSQLHEKEAFEEIERLAMGGYQESDFVAIFNQLGLTLKNNELPSNIENVGNKITKKFNLLLDSARQQEIVNKQDKTVPD